MLRKLQFCTLLLLSLVLLAYASLAPRGAAAAAKPSEDMPAMPAPFELAGARYRSMDGRVGRAVVKAKFFGKTVAKKLIAEFGMYLPETSSPGGRAIGAIGSNAAQTVVVNATRVLVGAIGLTWLPHRLIHKLSEFGGSRAELYKRPGNERIKRHVDEMREKFIASIRMDLQAGDRVIFFHTKACAETGGRSSIGMAVHKGSRALAAQGDSSIQTDACSQFRVDSEGTEVPAGTPGAQNFCDWFADAAFLNVHGIIREGDYVVGM